MADPQDSKKNLAFDKKDVNGQNWAREPKDLQDLTQHVQGLLQHMQDKFTEMSEQILGRIDDMSRRMEDMERDINDIVSHVGLESSVTPTSGGSTGAPQQALPHSKEQTPEPRREEKP